MSNCNHLCRECHGKANYICKDCNVYVCKDCSPDKLCSYCRAEKYKQDHAEPIDFGATP